MSTVNDGGPAFPAPKNSLDRAGPLGGMTLRDYFAAKALVGLFAIEANPRVGEICEPFRADKHCDQMAEISYQLADAMLRARGEK